MLNKGSTALAYMPYIPPYKNNTHWEGKQFNLFNESGKTSELSFYGIIDKLPATHTIRIVGTIMLRRNDGDLSNYYKGFNIANITYNVGVYADKIVCEADRMIGTCDFLNSDSLNGLGGRAYFTGSDAYVNTGRLYNASNGDVGGWAWDTIGMSQPILIDWLIEYRD
jgi:hypothetical protein